MKRTDIHGIDITSFEDFKVEDIKRWSKEKDEHQKKFKEMLKRFKAYIQLLDRFVGNTIPGHNNPNGYLKRILAANESNNEFHSWLEQHTGKLTVTLHDNGTRGSKMSMVPHITAEGGDYYSLPDFILNQYYYL